MKNVVLKAVMQKQTDNLKELFKLIEKHPDLPIVAMVDSDVVADDCYCYWLGEWGKCEVDKYIVHENYGVIFYEQGRPDTVDIFEKYFDYAECGIDEDLPDEKALPLMKEKIDTLDWTEAIIVYIVFCDNRCANTECSRHMSKLYQHSGGAKISKLRDTEDCEGYISRRKKTMQEIKQIEKEMEAAGIEK